MLDHFGYEIPTYYGTESLVIICFPNISLSRAVCLQCISHSSCRHDKEHQLSYLADDIRRGCNVDYICHTFNIVKKIPMTVFSSTAFTAGIHPIPSFRIPLEKQNAHGSGKRGCSCGHSGEMNDQTSIPNCIV